MSWCNTLSGLKKYNDGQRLVVRTGPEDGNVTLSITPIDATANPGKWVSLPPGVAFKIGLALICNSVRAVLL
jgi:hypothetical protein